MLVMIPDWPPKRSCQPIWRFDAERAELASASWARAGQVVIRPATSMGSGHLSLRNPQLLAECSSYYHLAS